jgi:mannose-1-phosphate guanylyltransferase
MKPQTEQQIWGIVLAGGEGTRVRDFLTHLCGGRGIKQFCAILGHRSMLEHTLARVERLIPRERILIVVSSHHRPEVEAQLASWPSANVIFQPAKRDTAPGILLPLAHVSHRAPFATVAIFPSDHFIVEEARFMSSVAQAVEETQRFRQDMTLLGMTPTEIEQGYGWIEPGATVQGRDTLAVRRFYEKPSLPRAHNLLRQGALVNTFVCVAQATTLWELARRATPDLYQDFMLIRHALQMAHAEEGIARMYRTMQTVNFSSAICEPLAARLRVLPVPDVGWSDWGSAERILASLQRLGKLDECLARLRRRGGKIPPGFPLPIQTPSPHSRLSFL